jgi:uncharacterized protein YdeI (YjbR/CyaY-like superfamily)
MRKFSSAELTFFASPSEWRAWLAENHRSASELWVGYYKVASGRPSMTWPESVDEALCFGWIDGLRRSIDEKSYRIRFTPRKEGSIWSAINTRRVAELTRLKRMAPAGLQAFESRDAKKTRLYSYERALGLGEEYATRLQANKKAWKDFESRPPWYRRTAGHWVMSAKKEETREKRLATLIACSAAGKKIPPLNG